MSDEIALDLRHNAVASRYEGVARGELAICTYYRDDDTLTFDHVLVPPPIEGLGLGTRLVRYAVEDVRAQGLFIVPRCPFVLAFFRKNPEYGDVLAPRVRRLVNRSLEGQA